jgi:hypothetical protein
MEDDVEDDDVDDPAAEDDKEPRGDRGVMDELDG